MLLRVDKILSECGICSRSQSQRLIKLGLVTADGRPVLSGADKIDPVAAELCVNGERVVYKTRVCLMLNKPAGVLTATEDSRQKTVIDLIGGNYSRMELFPVGRLDKDTEGLLLLTNDGQLAHNIISPKKEIWKVYYAEVDGQLGEEDVRAFESGLVLGDGTKCLPARLTPSPEEGGVYVTVHEGKYHQVKRMLASRGAPVTYLKRISIGGLKLDKTLKTGDFRELSEAEILSIFTIERESNA